MIDENSRSIRRHLVWGLSTVVLLVGGVGGWAATTNFAGAVIAPGRLIVEGSVKKVQHPVGGVIGAIDVEEGQRVEAGDVVVRLDATQARANLTILSAQMDELAVRQARLDAELRGLESLVVSKDMRSRSTWAAIQSLIAGENSLFETRRAAQAGLIAQLAEQKNQLRQQIVGLVSQTSAVDQQISLLTRELTGKQRLLEKKLITLQLLMPLEREKARLAGERGALAARVAQARGLSAEIDLKVLQIERDRRTEAARELTDVRAKLAELAERRIAAEDQVNRIDIRAPQTGIVHELSVHTVGGVVGAGETLMQIVPDSGALNVEVRLSPQAIDQIYVGQEARLRFSAFDQSTTPEVDGTVARVAADLTSDPRTGDKYFSARIDMDAAAIAKLGQAILPGMPVEAFIRTSDRTVLSYLTKPLTDQIERSFREE